MKKCPTCEKTFEDSMRFCQVDGTPLVGEVPTFDPYATIVAQPFSTAKEPLSEPVPVSPEPAAEPEIHYTVGSIPISEPEDVLDLPSDDPLRTMYVSDAEMQVALSKEEAGRVLLLTVMFRTWGDALTKITRDDVERARQDGTLDQ